jgi:CRISPR/Cas system-associated protein Cas7 (RAMP superfamily)
MLDDVMNYISKRDKKYSYFQDLKKMFSEQGEIYTKDAREIKRFYEANNKLGYMKDTTKSKELYEATLLDEAVRKDIYQSAADE